MTFFNNIDFKATKDHGLLKVPSDWNINGFFENHWPTIVEEEFLLEKGSVVWGYVSKGVQAKDRENRIYVSRDLATCLDRSASPLLFTVLPC